MSSNRAVIFFYFFAQFTLPIGMFIIPFMYGAEIAPLGIRHKVTAMGAATSWLFNFMVAEVTPIAFANIGWRYTSSTRRLVQWAASRYTCSILRQGVDHLRRLTRSSFNRKRCPVRVAKRLLVGLEVVDMVEATGKGVEAEHGEGL
jgi:hypothetical protein